MDFLPTENYKKILVIAFYCLIAGIFLFVFFKYLLGLLLPFLIAFGVSLCIRPLAEKFHKRTGIPKKLLCVVLVLVILAFLGLLMFLLVDKLIFEMREIFSYAAKNADVWISQTVEYINKLSDKFPFLDAFANEEELKSVLSDLAETMLAKFTQNVPSALSRIIVVLPKLLFVSLILIMASYYFCADIDDIYSFFSSMFPQKISKVIPSVSKRLKNVGVNIAKGYLLTMFLTFVQLYIGFLILKTDYAFSLALITAFVDILPIIGVGTVLIPWAAVKLIAGSYYQGFGLLIVFSVVSVVKEIIEPRIIGKSIGLHPLATLFSMYLGLEICGFVGLITFPALVICIKSLLGRVNVK